MPDYVAPLADIRFVLDHVVDVGALASLEPFAHAKADVVHGVLEETARFMEEVVAPTNRIGDTEGLTLDADGSVTTPEAFRDAYRRYVEAGWGAVPFDPAYGGGGFPWLVNIVQQEMLTSANMAFSMAPLLTQGAIDMLHAHGSEEQREVYLPKMVSGEWTGTMNLTEPDAGSDVGALRTRAVPADDGTWRISGTKIFISFGEHDMADNIIHLVLARVPDAPPGTKGISCFIVPKHLVADDGSLGPRNDVTCVSIEHKMGIKASPTCVLSYGERGEGAVGYLIGEPNAGMRYMFTMMNNARLSVGVEGLALAERAYQQAVAFACERRQGRAPGAPRGESSPIVDHPDVRRMLMSMKASVEAMRCLLYLNAESIDLANSHPDEAVRTERQELVELLTPISKAWCTDLGVEVTSLNVQVHGGMGYVEETGASQHYRDARIAPIYEGTNGIQAMDLVGRKLGLSGGAVVERHLAAMEAVAAEATAEGGDLAAIGVELADGVAALRDATGWLMEHGLADPIAALAGAAPYLRMFGTVTGGWLLARSALAATRLLAADNPSDQGFLEAKVVTARFYATQVLPTARGLLASVTAGPDTIMAIPAEHLWSR
ncbi:MAG TPA: acyl-CoA dehydrogenase [Acidimicrobiales bacterium]|nr:acyl-CoA dehydrogenase [Acidimicrobiales bacterium]